MMVGTIADFSQESKHKDPIQWTRWKAWTRKCTKHCIPSHNKLRFSQHMEVLILQRGRYRLISKNVCLIEKKTLWYRFVVGFHHRMRQSIKHVVRIASLMQYLLQDRRIMCLFSEIHGVGGLHNAAATCPWATSRNLFRKLETLERKHSTEE